MKPEIEIEYLPNGTPIHLVKVEGGSFMMGNNKLINQYPEHQVDISDFYLAQHPITNLQFLPCLQELGNQNEERARWINLNGNADGYKPGIKQLSSKYICVSGLEKHPIAFISWFGAQAYCKWLSKKTGKKYRLPSEAEWEYAAREQKYKKTYKYSGGNKLEEVGWYRQNSHMETKPVGMKVPNELGLFDMSGNVWEWCADYWFDTYENVPGDGRARINKHTLNKVIRGGSFANSKTGCQIDNRYEMASHRQNATTGFRIARDS